MEEKNKNAKTSGAMSEGNTNNENNGNNNNNNNAEKIAQLLKVAAEKGTKAREKDATDAQKTDATNASSEVIKILEAVPMKNFIKIQGKWYKRSGETRESWLTFTGTDKDTKESVSVTPEKVEEKLGKCLYIITVIFDARGWVMETGQQTKGLFEKDNSFKSKSQIKDLFNLEKETRPTSKDPNAAAVKALAAFAAAVGAKFEAAVFDGVDNAAEVILSGAQKMIDGQQSEMKEIARNKAISAAVAKMKENGVAEDKATAAAAELYKEGSTFNDVQRNGIISAVCTGIDFKSAVAFYAAAVKK